MPRPAPTITRAVRLSPSHNDRLDAVFAGPVLLAKLLRAEQEPITDISKAKLFLLKNKPALQPYLASGDHDQVIALMTSLVLEWSNTPPDEFAIPFRGCTISHDRRVFFPGVGLLQVQYVEDLEKPLGATRYTGEVTLDRWDGRYFAIIEYQLPRPKEPREPKVRPVAPNKKTNKKAASAARGKSFWGRIQEYKQQEERKTRSYRIRSFYSMFNTKHFGKKRPKPAHAPGYYTQTVFDGLNRRPYQGGDASSNGRRGLRWD